MQLELKFSDALMVLGSLLNSFPSSSTFAMELHAAYLTTRRLRHQLKARPFKVFKIHGPPSNIHLPNFVPRSLWTYNFITDELSRIQHLCLSPTPSIDLDVIAQVQVMDHDIDHLR